MLRFLPHSTGGHVVPVDDAADRDASPARWPLTGTMPDPPAVTRRRPTANERLKRRKPVFLAQPTQKRATNSNAPCCAAHSICSVKRSIFSSADVPCHAGRINGGAGCHPASTLARLGNNAGAEPHLSLDSKCGLPRRRLSNGGFTGPCGITELACRQKDAKPCRSMTKF